MTGQLRLWAALLAFSALLFAAPLRACMVCIPFPEETAVDRLIYADVVVLARENPDKPFTYLAKEVIKGKMADPEIDLFLNSLMRRRLQTDSNKHALLAFQRQTGKTRAVSASSDSSVDGEWRLLGLATPAYESIARNVLAREARWRNHANGSERAAFFMPYLADADPRIRELAYLEVGKAPYETIREADQYVSSAQIATFLNDPLYIEWQRLYILLLGVEANPGEAESIRKRMSDYARSGYDFNLSAWATALIEVDGAEAVAWLRQHYLANPGPDSESVLEVVKAMSVHGARKTAELRDPIAEAYASMIKLHPDLAGWVARDLTAWQDWRLAGQLEEIRKREQVTDGASAYAIDYYVGRARSAQAN